MQDPPLKSKSVSDKISWFDRRVLDGLIQDASDEDLATVAHALCLHPIDTKMTVGEINKGLLINHIQMARRFDRLHEDNADTQRLVVILAVVAILVGIIEVVVAIIEWCI